MRMHLKKMRDWWEVIAYYGQRPFCGLNKKIVNFLYTLKIMPVEHRFVKKLKLFIRTRLVTSALLWTVKMYIVNSKINTTKVLKKMKTITFWLVKGVQPDPAWGRAFLTPPMLTILNFVLEQRSQKMFFQLDLSFSWNNDINIYKSNTLCIYFNEHFYGLHWW